MSITIFCCCWVLWLFNILGHQHRFWHRAWKSPTNFAQRLYFRLEVLLCAVNLWHGTHSFTSLLKEVILRIFTLWKIHRPQPGSNLRTSDPEASMITTGPPRSTKIIRINSDETREMELSWHDVPSSAGQGKCHFYPLCHLLLLYLRFQVFLIILHKMIN